MSLRIPLTLIFVFQSLMVVGAFVAVILVLTEQQRSEFAAAVEQRLSLQQRHAMQLIYGPMEARLQVYTTTMHRFKRRLALDPRLIANENSTLGTMQAYYDDMYSVVATDPLTQYVMMATRTPVPAPVPGTTYWATYGLDAAKAFMMFGGSLSVCASLTVPVNTSGCGFVSVTPFNNLGFGLDDLIRFYGARTVWSSPSVVFDPVTGLWVPILVMRIPLGWSTVYNLPTPVAFVSVALPFVKAIVGNTTIAPSSVAALFAYDRTGYSRFGNCSLVAGRMGFADYNLTGFESASVPARTWPCGQTPDKTLNDVWAHGDARCSGSLTACAAPVVFEMGSGSSAVVASFMRLKTAEELDALLVQYTPRDYFYAASERARRDGILIGAFAALGVALSCVGILVAIRRPIAALQANMDLAAVMKNDEVVPSVPLLSEIAQLARAFDQMNTKLSLARPFLPQSLLMAADDDDDDQQDADGAETEGDINSTSVITGIEHSDSVDSTASHTHPHQRKSRRTSNLSQNTTTTVQRDNDTTTTVSVIARRTAKLTTTEAVARFSILTTRRVGVLVVNLRGFHAALRTITPERLTDVHRHFAQHVERCAAAHKGLVDAFHGDRFVLAFNTARTCGLPALSAAHVAVELATAAAAAPMVQGTFAHGLSMGMSCGRALVGNMGTATMQRLVTVGDAFSEAVGLQEVLNRGPLAGPAKEALPGRCLVTGRVLSEVEQGCVTHVVGRTSYRRFVSGVVGADCNEAQSAAFRVSEQFVEAAQRGTCKPGPDATAVVLLAVIARQVSSAGTADEWMYELSAQTCGGAGGDCVLQTSAVLAAALLFSGPADTGVAAMPPALVARWRAVDGTTDPDARWYSFLAAVAQRAIDERSCALVDALTYTQL